MPDVWDNWIGDLELVIQSSMKSAGFIEQYFANEDFLKMSL